MDELFGGTYVKTQIIPCLAQGVGKVNEVFCSVSN